jgi:hypothetical protein
MGWHLGGYYTPTWVDRHLPTVRRPSVALRGRYGVEGLPRDGRRSAGDDWSGSVARRIPAAGRAGSGGPRLVPVRRPVQYTPVRGFPGFVPKLWVATIQTTSTAGSMDGTARRSPRTTCGPCGVCWHWSACLDPSTTRLCPASPGGTAPRSSNIRRLSLAWSTRSNGVGWSIDLGRGPSPLVLRFGMRDGRR